MARFDDLKIPGRIKQEKFSFTPYTCLFFKAWFYTLQTLLIIDQLII